MTTSSIDEKVKTTRKAAEKTSKIQQEVKQRNKYKGQFGEATIQKIIEDEQNLNKNEVIKFELLMPDMNDIRYLSFTKEELDSDFYREFCEYLNTTTSDMNVLFKKIPVTYTGTNWKASFRTHTLAKQVRNGRYLSINTQGQLQPTKWLFIIPFVIAVTLSIPAELFSAESIKFIIWNLYISIVALPLLISYLKMDSMITALTTLKRK